MTTIKKNDEVGTRNDELKTVHRSSFRLHRSGETGGGLIGLMAVMTLMAFALLAAAPSLMQDVQREKELEAIRRGEEVAQAIRIYAEKTGRLPKSMDELLEGVSVPGRTKKLMVLRESAAKDPLSTSGEWRLVQSNDKVFSDFYRKVVAYNGGKTPDSPLHPALQKPFAQIVSIINTETSEDTDPPGGEDDSNNMDVEFIGVVSRRQTKSVLAFYGIERHDWWVFTPLFRGGGQQNNNRGQGSNQIGIGNEIVPPPPPPE